ncbi:hypothetical protein EBR21_17980 [bacterium]|nr:hypothetical protein [bacterium]
MAKRVVLGILEDMEYLYFPWEIASQATHRPCVTLWFGSFEECFAKISMVDILVADWELVDPVLQTSKYLFDFIPDIRRHYKGPIVLYSVNKPPQDMAREFALVLSNPTKSPPDLDWLMDSVLPAT